MALRPAGKRLVLGRNRSLKTSLLGIEMDNLSSSDLDSPSKTPLFIAVAAVIVALAGLGLGWMGFSRAAALEAKIVALEQATAGAADLDAAVNANARRVDQVAANMTTFSQEVNRVMGAVEEDISNLKKNLRAVAIDAGTAKKMVEELEKSGVKAAPAAAAAAATPARDGAAATAPAVAGKGGMYTIKSGDTLGRIATAHGISLSALQGANPDVDERRLRIGQQIVIPGSN